MADHHYQEDLRQFHREEVAVGQADKEIVLEVQDVMVVFSVVQLR